VKSSDPVFGWGPKNGYVFQKPFVEFFVPASQFQQLKEKMDAHDQVTYFAGNAQGDIEASDEDSVNPVTWGTFAGKEIVTPTIIEAVSFRSWLEEAFSIWREWQRIYQPRSVSSKLLSELRQDVWLVNVIWGDFVQGEGLWEFLGV
jgi:methylenetetrahydrofolate reductase (NADPH)